MNNVIDFFKSKKGIIISCCTLFVIIITILCIILNSNKVTKLEKIKIEEYTNKYFDYIDTVLLYPNNEERYLNFALTYLVENNDKTVFTNEEVIDFINDTFSLNYTDKDITKIVLVEGKLKSSYKYDKKKKEFTYVGSVSRKDIAETTISEYEITKIKKKSNNKFVVTFNKYTVENPYLIYNYYNELNSKKDEKEDLTDLTEYLKGNRKVSDIKKYISKNNIEKFGKIKKNVKITFIIKNDKLTIE